MRDVSSISPSTQSLATTVNQLPESLGGQCHVALPCPAGARDSRNLRHYRQYYPASWQPRIMKVFVAGAALLRALIG
jgi:hypothetical protein